MRQKGPRLRNHLGPSHLLPDNLWYSFLLTNSFHHHIGTPENHQSRAEQSTNLTRRREAIKRVTVSLWANFTSIHSCWCFQSELHVEHQRPSRKDWNKSKTSTPVWGLEEIYLYLFTYLMCPLTCNRKETTSWFLSLQPEGLILVLDVKFPEWHLKYVTCKILSWTPIDPWALFFKPHTCACV